MGVAILLLAFFCLAGACACSRGGSFPKPLSSEDEQKTLEDFFQGTEQQKTDAKERLILHNLRLVAHIAKKYTASPKDTEEMISIGTIGLIKAIQTFKPEKKSKLASYASRCIENEILMHLRAMKKTQNEISLYEPVGTDRDGNEIVMLDIINTDTPDFAADLDFSIETQKLADAMKTVLTPRERFVICLRYGLGRYDVLTQQEIAKKLGISRSYVSRIEKKALQKLCRALEGIQG